MNLAKVGRPSIAWYYDFQSTTSKSIDSLLKFSGVPNMTSSVIVPMGVTACPGTMPWKVVSDATKFVIGLFILLRVSAKIMLMPLPPSMNTFFRV